MHVHQHLFSIAVLLHFISLSSKKTQSHNSLLYQEKHFNNRGFSFFFFFLTLLTWLHEKRQGSGEGMSSTIWRRREEGVQGPFVCTPHPLNTQSGLYCILQIYTQDVGLECFPEKKKKKKEGGFFFSSKCLLS